MKIRFFSVGVVLSTLLWVSACSSSEHNHEAEGHDHESEEAHGHNHEHEEETAKTSTDEISISPEKANAAGIRSVKLQPSDFAEVIEASGRIQSAQGGEAMVVANAEGIVSLSHPMAEGTAVSKGTALVTINAQNLPTSDPVQRARIAYEAAKKEFDRGEQLVKNKLISEREFTALRETYEEAKLSYTSLSKNYHAGKQVITSLINGYIQQCFVKEGDFVTVGQQLALIAANQRLSLKVDVAEKYYASLPSIHSANVKLPSGELLQLASMNGKVVSYGRTTDQSYYVPMTFEFDNKGRILSGAFVEVYLLGSPTPRVLAVPTEALIEEQGLYFVFIQLDEDCYRKQEVTLGRSDGLRTEILSGLKSGDNVVVKGAYQVKLAGASNAIPAHSHSH